MSAPRKKTILIINDGIGYNPKEQNNAFAQANKPTFEYLLNKVPKALIKTSALSVGLPEGQMGDSEVGHLSIGSGRVIYQSFVKISKSLEDGSLENHPKLKSFINSSNKIHIIGLLSDGGVHGHIDHIKGLNKIFTKQNKEVCLHIIGDGRDVAPKSILKYIKDLKTSIPNANICTISGRYYTMDRDNRWDRVQKGYEAIMNASNPQNMGIEEYVENSYANDITDEFLIPASLNGYEGIKDTDGVIFSNFRKDRMREIVKAFGVEEFDEFKTSKKNINILNMTNYNSEYNLPVLFEDEDIKNTLAEVISKNNLTQMHTAETEKYAHVTFYFNGGKNIEWKGEDRILIPSPKVATYDLQPEMNAPLVGDAVVESIDKKYDFIVANFANGDMVGHTGSLEAATKAVEAVDKELAKILKKASQNDYSVIITADHGNCELMEDEKGNTITSHTTNEVFCFVIDDEVKEVKEGSLVNLAATVLELMGLEKPNEMANSLINVEC